MAVVTPRRAISSEPGTAAMANSIDGRPVRMPIWVAFRFSSSWMSGMTGGTAKMVSRNAQPPSHSSTSAVSTRCCDGASPAFRMDGPGITRRMLQKGRDADFFKGGIT